MASSHIKNSAMMVTRRQETDVIEIACLRTDGTVLTLEEDALESPAGMGTWMTMKTAMTEITMTAGVRTTASIILGQTISTINFK